MTQTSQTDGQS
jgi:hypothetical protein